MDKVSVLDSKLARRLSDHDIISLFFSFGYDIKEPFLLKNDEYIGTVQVWKTLHPEAQPLLVKLTNTEVLVKSNNKWLELLPGVTEKWRALLKKNFKMLYENYLYRMTPKEKYIGHLSGEIIKNFLTSEGVNVTKIESTDNADSQYLVKTKKNDFYLESFDIYDTETCIDIEPLKTNWLKFMTAKFGNEFIESTVAYCEKCKRDEMMINESSIKAEITKKVYTTVEKEFEQRKAEMQNEFNKKMEKLRKTLGNSVTNEQTK